MADYPISNVPRRVQYVNSGVGPYAFAFEVLTQTDIAVYRGSTLLTLTADYTVTINANGTGSVTLVTAGTGNITIAGARAVQRSSDYTTGGDLFASTLNTDLDSQTIFSQQLAEDVTRSVKAPVYDSTILDMSLPNQVSRANKLFGFNALGAPAVSTNTVAAVDAAVNTITSISGAPSGSSAGISHIASGSNAVTRTVQSKLRDIVNVKDFGAVGNNVADDSTAIQNAINATPSGGKLYIPTGTYLITTGLTRTNSITIQGDGIFGAGGTALNYTGNGIAFTYGGGGGSSAGARFQDFRIVGTSAGQIGFKIYHAFNGIKLDKVYVEDFTTGDALYVEDAWDIEFSKCTFRTSLNGVNCGSGALFGVVNACNWISCDIINNSNVGLAIYSGSNNVVFGCDFSGTNVCAVDLANSLTTSANHACLSNIIDSCYFEGNNPPSGSEDTLIKIGESATISTSGIQGNVINKAYTDFKGDYIRVYNGTANVISNPQIGSVEAGKQAIIIDSPVLRTKIEWQSRANITNNSTTTNFITNDVLSAPGDIFGNFETPTRSAFNVSANQASNVTGNGTKYLIGSSTEQKDYLNELSNGVFTATKRGMYYFTGIVNAAQASGATRLLFGIDTSNVNYEFVDCTPQPNSSGGLLMNGSIATFMDAGDTAQLFITVSGLVGDTVDVAANFSGHLIG
jgi:hypothetical protein